MVNKLAQCGALATKCGLLRISQQSYMEAAEARRDYIGANNAELKAELYKWFEQRLSEILFSGGKE